MQYQRFSAIQLKNSCQENEVLLRLFVHESCTVCLKWASSFQLDDDVILTAYHYKHLTRLHLISHIILARLAATRDLFQLV